MSIPFGEPIGGRGECFVTCDCYSIRGDTRGVICKISLSVYSYYVDMHIDISSTKFDERDYHEYEGSSYKCVGEEIFHYRR